MKYVLRDGQLVEKRLTARRIESDFPTPMLSRFEEMESPVTGKAITSWRERDRDMDRCGAVDRRDLPSRPFEQRNEDNARQRKLPEQWGGIPDS